jgi:hypothetical protein
MTAELLIAGACTFLLALGHTLIGLRWILPHLSEARLPATPFGPPSLTVGMVRFSWEIISVILPGFGVLFLVLAWTDADPRTVILRWAGALWLAATAVSLWNTRRRLRSLARFPAALFMAIVAAMCWIASA